MNDTSILARIRGLLAKAESTDFEAEAEALRDKATELIAKYQIDEALLATETGGPRPIVKRFFSILAPYRYEQAVLWFSVGKVFGVHCITHTEYDRYDRLVCWGTESAIDTMELLVASLMVQGARQSRQVKAAPRFENPGYYSYQNGPSTASLRRSFLAGFYKVAAERVSEAHGKAVEASGVGLVLVADLSRSKDACREEYGKIGRGPRKSYNTSGLDAGRTAGANADIGRSRLAGRMALNA